MTKKLAHTLEIYYQKLKLLRAFGVAESLLSWDRETWMPKGASADRGETMATLAGFSHQLFTDSEFVKVVQELHDHQADLEPIDRRSVILTQKELNKSIKLTTEFVEETNVIINSAYSAWVEAKQSNNFALFQPHLKAVIENRQQYAEFLNSAADPYDVLLDDYEEGLCTAQLVPLFQALKTGLVELLPQVLKQQTPVTHPLDAHQLDPHQLEAFLRSMVSTIGFDLNRGAFGSVEHPFEISISPNDTRINTSYAHHPSSFTITGMIHELGHGLYEQNINSLYVKPGLDHGVSLGIHESQSRFLENMIGRTTAFWSYFLPQLQAMFPELRTTTVDEVQRSLTVVQPSLIRTEADEVTYNLHIILRFELEQKLIHHRLAVKDLPEAWKAKSQELLGVVPSTDQEGVLQDVHWAWGNIGYFPTYTIGNMNAAQLLAAFSTAHPDWQKEVTQGNFRTYFNWFREKVWQHGSFFTPQEIMTQATGKDTQAQYLLEYLRSRYLVQK